MRIAIWILVGLAVAFLLFALRVRLAGDDPARWHVDPLAAQRTGKPNDILLTPGGDKPASGKAPVFALSPGELAQRLLDIALAEERTALIAGSGEDGWFTLVQRTALMRYPDYISVRVLPADGGATLAIWSRSRFGYSDRGVNKMRVRRWLKALEQGG